MYRVLVVDDEKIEREGIKFLLSREEGEFEISEASNGRQALEILRNEEIDLLLTDIKMPHMDGLELAKKAKEEKEELQIVIFSGYNDFSFAQEAIRYGVKEYVLKPVDPDIFSETLEKVRSEIDKNKNRKIRDQKEQDFLQQYFLQNYIYTGKKEILEKAGEMINLDTWNQWHCAILVESSQNFFDTADENLAEDMRKELRRIFFYLNLNARQSLFLFNDVYCDYLLVANQLYTVMKRQYPGSFHLAVSRKFEGCEALPEIMTELEQQMEERFYHPENHVFSNEEEEYSHVDKATQDSQLMQRISEDISRKDIQQLKVHFQCLTDKYKSSTQFSAMYIKFVLFDKFISK